MSMNISRQNIAGKCNLKCNYTFKYPVSNCTATNHVDRINISYDKSSTPPVTFNNIKYDVASISLYSPSKHLFNNVLADGEIIINHTSPSGAPALNVCIPITTSGKGSTGSLLIQDIISETSNGAANPGESTTIKLDNFTLDSIVPVHPFFNYTFKKENYIVYGIMEALTINAASMEILKKIIKPSHPFPSGSTLFINIAGPNRGKGADEIYIDCQPTGSSEETTVVTTDTKSETTFDISEITSNPVFLFFLSGLIFIVVILMLNYLVTYLASGEIPNAFAKKAIYTK